jgi:hypothetical protein
MEAAGYTGQRIDTDSDSDPDSRIGIAASV